MDGHHHYGGEIARAALKVIAALIRRLDTAPEWLSEPLRQMIVAFKPVELHTGRLFASSYTAAIVLAGGARPSSSSAVASCTSVPLPGRQYIIFVKTVDLQKTHELSGLDYASLLTKAMSILDRDRIAFMAAYRDRWKSAFEKMAVKKSELDTIVEGLKEDIEAQDMEIEELNAIIEVESVEV